MPIFRVILIRIFPHSDENNSVYGHFLRTYASSYHIVTWVQSLKFTQVHLQFWKLYKPVVHLHSRSWINCTLLSALSLLQNYSQNTSRWSYNSETALTDLLLYGESRFVLIYTAWKLSVFGVFLLRIFPHSEYLSVFSSNEGTYGPEKLRSRTRFIQWWFREK